MLTRLFTRRRCLLVLMGCWLSAAAPAALPGEWRNDFSPAVQVAIQSGKQNLLLFTGLDWEQQSRRFRTEVLEKPEFARALSADFVLTHSPMPSHIKRAVVV